VVAAGAAAAGFNLGSVIFAWIALVVTTDPLAVGLVFAVRFLMLLILGIPAGVLADRVDRRRMFQASALGSAAVAVALALLAAASGNTLPLWALVVGSMVLGSFDALRIAAAQAYAFDLVGPMLATTGLALANLCALSGAVVGSIAGGYVLDHGGVAPAFLVLAVVQVSVAGALAWAGAPERRAPRPPSAKGSGLRESLTLLQRHRVVRLLAIVVIVVEILGFSSATLLPVFTLEVFDAGPGAYGTLNAVRSLGGVVALLVVVWLGPRAGTGLGLLGASLLFGLALVVFAVSPAFAMALIAMLLVGAAGAAADSLSQTLIQRTVTDTERGAAMGVWAFALGFGPLGSVVAGALAGRYGPVPTQVLFGLALAGASVAFMTRPVLRRLR
jgi:MFS family permease